MRKQLAAILLIMSLFVAACTARRGPEPAPQPGGTPGQTQPTPTQPTPTQPTPGSTQPGPGQGPAQPPPAPGPKAIFHTFQMTSETEGWASGKALLHTTDAGRTWLDTLPLSERHTWTALGAGRAWAATTAPDERHVLVHRTADGGKTWASAQVPLPDSVAPGASPVSISFADATRGWLMIEPMRTMNAHPGYLYATADGGATWKLSASTDDTLPVGGQIRLEPGRPDEGWLAGNQVSTAPHQLYRTTDGGRTWEQQELKLPPDRLEPGKIDYGLPVISPEGREGLLTATWVPDNGAFAAYATLLFRTSDGGTNWDHLGVYLPPGTVGTYDGAHAWVWMGIPREPGSGSIVSGSWTVKSAPWTVGEALEPDATLVTALEDGWNITALQFVTYYVGWALLTKPGEDPRLLQTKDAAQTWTRVN